MEVSDKDWLQINHPRKDPDAQPRRRKAICKGRKRHLTMAQREKIIVFRFGQLNRLSHIVRPMKWIAAKMGIIYSTVVRIVSNYKKAGCVINYETDKWDRTRMKCKLTTGQENFLVGINTLEKWKHLTLEQRCRKIFEKYKV